MMIVFDNVSKTYPNGEQALKNVSFQLNSGEIAFLTGHSGAGKSTLLELLMLTEKPSSGLIKIHKLEWSKTPKRKIPIMRRRIGMVHQNNKLLADHTVFDNVALPLLIAGMHGDKIQKRVMIALSKVKLQHKAQSFPHQLSLGEQQRVGIARAVVNNPSILIADEPTGNLDPSLSEDVMDLFQKFAQVGVCVLIASHDRHLISRYRKRVLILQHGELIYDSNLKKATQATSEVAINRVTANQAIPNEAAPNKATPNDETSGEAS